METISDIKHAIDFCDKKILITQNKFMNSAHLNGKELMTYWMSKKEELEELMEQKVKSIHGINKDKDDKD